MSDDTALQVLTFPRAGGSFNAWLGGGPRWNIQHFDAEGVAQVASFGQPSVRTIDVDKLLGMLTEDEARLVMGYCCHITEHAATHAAYLHEAMGVALAERDWAALASINDEMDACLVVQLAAGVTGRTIFESGEEVMA